tara:strand:+ start:62 stop:304 length:243 start_codon:yes stop_codon:yes gene_type:complete
LVAYCIGFPFYSLAPFDLPPLIERNIMNDKLYYFLLGFMIMGLVAMISVTHNPEPKTVSVCGKCGSQEWWFQLAEGEQNE